MSGSRERLFLGVESSEFAIRVEEERPFFARRLKRKGWSRRMRTKTEKINRRWSSLGRPIAFGRRNTDIERLIKPGKLRPVKLIIAEGLGEKLLAAEELTQNIKRSFPLVRDRAIPRKRLSLRQLTSELVPVFYALTSGNRSHRRPNTSRLAGEERRPREKGTDARNTVKSTRFDDFFTAWNRTNGVPRAACGEPTEEKKTRETTDRAKKKNFITLARFAAVFSPTY